MLSLQTYVNSTWILLSHPKSILVEKVIGKVVSGSQSAFVDSLNC